MDAKPFLLKRVCPHHRRHRLHWEENDPNRLEGPGEPATRLFPSIVNAAFRGVSVGPPIPWMFAPWPVRRSQPGAICDGNPVFGYPKGWTFLPRTSVERAGTVLGPEARPPPGSLRSSAPMRAKTPDRGQDMRRHSLAGVRVNLDPHRDEGAADPVRPRSWRRGNGMKGAP